MKRPSIDQSVFIKGVLSADAEHNEDADADIASTRLVITTQDNFMGSVVEQFHNVIVIKDAAIAVKDMVKGDAISIVGKLLWLESEYLTQSIESERTAEVIAIHANKVEDFDENNSYHIVVISGEVMTEPEYTASMTGAITRSLIFTKDKIINDAIEQSHSVLAADKLAVKLKEFETGDTVQLIAQILWLDSEDYEGDVVMDDRSIELVIESVIGSKNTLSAKTRASQVSKNIIDLSTRIKEGEGDGAAYIQSILNKINGNDR